MDENITVGSLGREGIVRLIEYPDRRQRLTILLPEAGSLDIWDVGREQAIGDLSRFLSTNYYPVKQEEEG